MDRRILQKPEARAEAAGYETQDGEVKTAQIIAQTTERTSEGTRKARDGRTMNPESLKNLVAPWEPGQSGNPSGRPKDSAADISRAAFENNRKAIYEGVVAKLLAGDAYAFDVHANRGYGKVSQSIEVKTELRELSEAELLAKLELLRKELA
jgi:hypothetical protein